MIEDLNSATRPVCPRKSRVQRQQCRIERLRQRDIKRIPSTHRVAQLPSSRQQPAVPESLPGPVLEIGYRLPGCRTVQPPAQMLGTDYAHHLNVDHVRRYMVDIGG